MITKSQNEITKKWKTNWSEPLVSIRCTVFNHESYLEDCLDGFLLQETNFPFEVFVHDDASTDNSVAIIKKYEEKFPDIIKPLYEKENQCSKDEDSFMNATWDFTRLRGKYIALCEGDDYWIDSNKLQMQIDWLESHSDYTMCCSDAVISSSSKKFNWTCYRNDTSVPVKDMILGGGGFIPTCTIVIRKKLLDNYPKYCSRCYVGDYPLQIWAVLNGKVRYFSNKTGFYRYAHQGSWTSSQNDYKKQIPGWRSEVAMLQGLDLYSSYRFHEFFLKQQTKYILECAIFSKNCIRDKHDIQNIMKSFIDIKEKFNLLQKIDLFFAMRLPSRVYRITRALICVVGTLLHPSQQRRRQLSIKIQDVI